MTWSVKSNRRTWSFWSTSKYVKYAGGRGDREIVWSTWSTQKYPCYVEYVDMVECPCGHGSTREYTECNGGLGVRGARWITWIKWSVMECPDDP